jgi:hypothetical protein
MLRQHIQQIFSSSKIPPSGIIKKRTAKKSVGLSYAMPNFAQKWPDTTYCGVLFLKSLEFWIWL